MINTILRDHKERCNQKNLSLHPAMNFRVIISFGSVIFLFLISVIMGPGCANVIPPQGGLKDSIPPQLVKANPVNSATNFTGNRIVLTFNEYVDFQNTEALLVSPIPRIGPKVDPKLKTLTIKLKDSLEANTTYTINFGSTIRDYTEGNPLKEFTYTFSTGRYIDSLELRGKVVMAETGNSDSTLIVMLHTSANDSAVVKENPRYIAKVDGKGNFVFKNLPPKKYYLYALKGDYSNHTYSSDEQIFGFADKPMVIQSKMDPVTLYAYSAIPPTTHPANIPTFNLGARNKATSGNVEKRLRYQTTIIDNQEDLLSQFIMSFEQPLRSFDSSKIRIYTDSTFKPVSVYHFEKDSSKRKLQLSISWKENTLYHIILDKNFAEDSLGRKLLKTDTLHFRTKSMASYGALKLKFRDLDLAKNPVLQFVTSGSIYKSFVLTSADFSQALFLPGEYELRILYDDNKNGVWDPGQFFGKHKQPEIVRPIGRHISVKPSWQNEFEIAL